MFTMKVWKSQLVVLVLFFGLPLLTSVVFGRSFDSEVVFLAPMWSLGAVLYLLPAAEQVEELKREIDKLRRG